MNLRRRRRIWASPFPHGTGLEKPGAMERGILIVWHYGSVERLKRAEATLDERMNWMSEPIGDSQWPFLLPADLEEVSVFGPEGMGHVTSYHVSRATGQTINAAAEGNER